MGRVLAAFSMSLDGFVAGPDVSVEHPMGTGGERLHQWLFHDAPDRTGGADHPSVGGVDAEMARELFEKVGAVVLGRRTFDVGLGPWGDTPYPVPSFVVTHERRDVLAMKSAAFTFVNDGIESALRQARAEAGERDVLVMGAHLAQQYLKAGLVDDLFLQLVPVLLGAGSRLFDHTGGTPIELKSTRVVESPFVTHLRFEVVKV